MANQNTLPVRISVAADSTIPMLGVRLSSTSVLGKVQAQTTLYTVPTGKTAVVTHIVLRMTSASNVTGVATITAGVTAAWTSILASTALTGFDATGEYIVLHVANPSIVTAAAGVIKLDVATGATTTDVGDTYTFNVSLFGYLY